MANGNEPTQVVLAEVGVSAPRRWLGVAMLTVIGGLVIYVALATPPAPGWQAFLIATGLAALWVAERMRRATGSRIELTMTELRETGGETIALVAEIEAVDRGFFALKPSNGFLLRTRQPGSRRWRPGLWWRMGRRVGVGGVTPARQTKMMSEMLAAMLAERDHSGGDHDPHTT
ncbi:hypothetical protein [Pukyongiella litopenaei]|uniref:Uncharacterized protein n=1 Tax=Pukyongiella litopenaei TaxID=2605946 RepID=A0A2S0MUH9_9RHOB|nr:hypothetical protein [Pukyongiella litopenaei]AVO39554.1 hypothetical protein C6Y53_00055 [Pukyongiella litopenaei]